MQMLDCEFSVIIIAHNAERTIERCLESVAWADEIIVVDSYSDDRTEEICRRYTEKFYQHKWEGFGRQKNRALGYAT